MEFFITHVQSGVTMAGEGKEKDIKEVIFYHRAYRRPFFSARGFLLRLFILVAPLEAALLVFYPRIVLAMNGAARLAFSGLLPGSMPGMGDVFWLPGRYPSPLFCLLLFVFSILSSAALLKNKSRIAKPLVLWLLFVSAINLVSSAVFLAAPSAFRWTVRDFSEYYVRTELCIWALIPFLTGLALAPVPSGLWSQWGTVSATLLYSLLFGTVRFIAFIYVLCRLSLAFMPVLFFVFGPLADFVYIVSAYSLHISAIAANTKADLKAWRWLY